MKHIKSFKVFDDLDFLNESKLYILPTFYRALNYDIILYNLM